MVDARGIIAEICRVAITADAQSQARQLGHFSSSRHTFSKDLAMTKNGDLSLGSGVTDMERLKMLFDYTKFHIGLYGTLVAALIALAGSKFADQWQLCLPPLWCGIVAILLAGWAGGVIAGTLPQRLSFDDFWESETGPFSCAWWPGRVWTYIEHTAFWIGIGCVFFAFVLAHPS